ncbi:MAG: NUDIX domain-containing protein [Granulosicoccaceae bacterium]
MSTTKKWETVSDKDLHNGFYRIHKLGFRHTLFNGGWSEIQKREQFDRGNVVAVLPYDPQTRQVALVEQFRIGARFNQPDPWLMEVIAGMMEKDEEPEEVAIRETFEEAGIRLDNVSLVRQYYASPSSTTEEVFVFTSECDLSNAGGVFGLAEEGEDIKVHIVSIEKALEWLNQGVIKNAISVIALQCLALQEKSG